MNRNQTVVDALSNEQAIACLAAFETYIRQDEIRQALPEYFLKKLEGYNQFNPEYMDRLVDGEWVIWRKSWISCLKSSAAVIA
jgi:hypothetical protein